MSTLPDSGTAGNVEAPLQGAAAAAPPGTATAAGLPSCMGMQLSARRDVVHQSTGQPCRVHSPRFLNIDLYHMWSIAGAAPLSPHSLREPNRSRKRRLSAAPTAAAATAGLPPPQPGALQSTGALLPVR